MCEGKVNLEKREEMSQVTKSQSSSICTNNNGNKSKTSSSNYNGTTTTSSGSTKNHYYPHDLNQEKDQWNVQVYRYTAARGWEMYQDVVQQQDQDDHNQPIVVTPRKGCVEVAKLRLRVNIFSSNTCHTTVIRRMDTILLSSRKSAGAIVLKFESIKDCSAFVDQLVHLNNEEYTNQTSKLVKEQEESSSTAKKTTSTSSKPEILSHIARLLHDDEFMDFVDHVEDRLIESSSDFKHILDATAHPRNKEDSISIPEYCPEDNVVE